MNKKIYLELSSKIYNISIILDNYCKLNETSEDLQNISPLVEYLHTNADNLATEIEKLI